MLSNPVKQETDQEQGPASLNEPEQQTRSLPVIPEALEDEDSAVEDEQKLVFRSHVRVPVDDSPPVSQSVAWQNAVQETIVIEEEIAWKNLQLPECKPDTAWRAVLHDVPVKRLREGKGSGEQARVAQNPARLRALREVDKTEVCKK